MGAYRNGIQLRLGMIGTNVSLSTAVAREQSLNTVCLGTHGKEHPITRIKEPTVCPVCDKDTKIGDFASHPQDFKKAREISKGNYAVIELDEIAAAKGTGIDPTKTTISLTAHPIEEVRSQTIQGESTYYLAPSTGFNELYGVVVDTIRRNPQYGFLGLWTPMSRTGLYEVRLFGDTLLMEARARTESLLIVPQPVMEPAEAMQQAIDLTLASFAKPYDPATYADTYKAALEALIESKSTVEGEASPGNPLTKATPTGVGDLMAALTAEVERLKAAA